MNVAEVKALADKVRAEIGKAIVGQQDTIDLLLTALFARGHVLLEGPPGTAKTYLAQCFARTLGLDFGRIQFTPDLMPADIIGSNVFNFQTSTFSLTEGPLFCELLLADEINRTPPKTQAALLEAMQERRVTIDGKSHALSDRFMVVATQNPLEQQGTYPLPEAQLDRFLFKQTLAYPEPRGGARASSPSYGMQSGHPDPAALRRRRASPTRQAARPPRTRRSAGIRLTDEIVGYVAGPGARPPARRRTCQRRPARARRRHAGRWRPARARRWTGATTSSPTTSRRWPCRRCATG